MHLTIIRVVGAHRHYNHDAERFPAIQNDCKLRTRTMLWIAHDNRVNGTWRPGRRRTDRASGQDRARRRRCTRVRDAPRRQHVWWRRRTDRRRIGGRSLSPASNE